MILYAIARNESSAVNDLPTSLLLRFVYYYFFILSCLILNVFSIELPAGYVMLHGKVNWSECCMKSSFSCTHYYYYKLNQSRGRIFLLFMNTFHIEIGMLQKNAFRDFHFPDTRKVVSYMHLCVLNYWTNCVSIQFLQVSSLVNNAYEYNHFYYKITSHWLPSWDLALALYSCFHY